MEWQRGEYTISTDRERLSLDVIYGYLSGSSYWAADRPREVVRASLEGSLCFGVYHADTQVGFARVITDRATLFHLCDVFILPGHRGQGLGKWLVGCVLEAPELAGLRGFLATRDAHGLYARFGFQPLQNPNYYMVRPAAKPAPPAEDPPETGGSHDRH